MPFGPLNCEYCGVTYWVTPQRRLKNSRFCSVLCRARGINTAEVRNKKGKGGRALAVPLGTRRKWLNRNRPGIWVKTSEGWVSEHRLLTQAPIGMSVHHIDEDPINNTPKNLQIMPQSDHARLHEHKRDVRIGRFVAAQQIA